jgi:hypothetical protein
MKAAALILAALFLSSCAIPVRPIAFVEKDKQGRTHFVPDEAQEPQVADAVSWFAPIIGLIGGPYGEAGLGVLALLLGHQVGHRRATNKAKRPPKIAADPAVTVTMP